MLSFSGLALLAVMALVVGPSASGSFVESSPFHSHVYLSADAAQSHGVDGHPDGSDVISTTDHSGASSAVTAHLVTPETGFLSARVATFVQHSGAEADYADPLFVPPDEPPQFS